MEIKEITKECIVCGACEAMAPEYFEVKDTIAVIKKKKVDKKDEKKVKETAESCPVSVIKLK